VVATATVLKPRPRPARYYINRLFALWVPLTLFLVFTLGPFYYMLVVSLKDQQLEVNEPSINPFWVFHPNLDQYIDLFSRTQFPRWALNTIVVASLSTIVSLTFGTLAGYALARLRFRGASLLGIISFVTYLVPQTLLFIPLNIVITRLPVSLFLVTVAFSTVAVGLPLLMLLIPPEKRVGWGPLGSWLPGILLLGIGVALGMWGLTAKGAALNEIDHAVGVDPDVSDLPGPVLHLVADRLLPVDPAGARRERAHRRCESGTGDAADRRPAGVARHPIGVHLRFHSELERVHLCAGVHDLHVQSDYPRRRRQRADPRRRVLLGHADGWCIARLNPGGGRLFVLCGQLRLGADRWRRKGLARVRQVPDPTDIVVLLLRWRGALYADVHSIQ
jgi:hypothetical protein